MWYVGKNKSLLNTNKIFTYFYVYKISWGERE